MNVLIGILVVISIAIVVLVEALTSMPLLAKIAIGVFTTALLFLALKFHGMAEVGSLVILIALGPTAIWLSQTLAHTPPILDAQGKPLAGSVAEMRAIDVNGVREWLIIRGSDIHKPVLLYLSGGPGASELGLVRGYDPALEDQFVVVIWEQPGTGKSYGARSYKTLTVDQYVADGLAVVQYLRERFGQDHIYVMGSSWGTILGVKMVKQQPDWFAAYIGMGQMVSTTENDVMSYEYALNYAQQKGDSKAVTAISKYGPPPYRGKGASLKYANYLTSYVNQYDAEAAGGSMPKDFMQKVLINHEYGLVDMINQLRGSMDGMDYIYAAQLGDLDLETEIQSLDVPVYLMEGRFDHNANAVLAERWFNKLQAPHKELIWFEHAAHSPMISETERFNQALAKILLAEPVSR